MTNPIDARLIALERQRASAEQAPPPAPADVPSLLAFVESLSIEDKDTGALIPFALWDAQKDALAMMEAEPRLFVLKARQLGLSWLALACLLYWGTFWGDRSFLIARQSGEDAADAIHRLKTLIASMPDVWRPVVVVDNVMSIEFASGSRYRALTATQRIGRGGAAYAGLADEFAFWDWQPEQLASLEAACSRLFVVTTGSGPGTHAHRLWTQAAAHKGAYKTLFLRYDVHPGRTPEWYALHVEEAADVRLAKREYASTAQDAWTSPSGVFFMRFDAERHVREVEIVPNWPTVRCIDHGFHRPACAWLQTSPQGQLFVVAELVPHDRTTQEFAQEILATELTFGLVEPPRASYCDPAGRAVNVQTTESEARIFAQMGLNPDSKPSSIRDGCVLLMDALADKNLPLVISAACPWTIQAFSQVKPDKANEGVYDERSEYTHILDALRYWAVNNAEHVDLSDWQPSRPTSPSMYRTW
jgi:hypothetical protein